MAPRDTLGLRPAAPLELYRRAEGLSRSLLAERCSIHPETIARIERGEHVPLRSTAMLIAAALGQRTEVLFPTLTTIEINGESAEET